MWAVVICLVGLLVRIGYWVYTWANPKCNGKLPPGSMGLPIIGESIEFFSPHGLYDIPPFISKRMARCGTLFRTSLVGQKIIVSTDPKINYSILQQENKNFLLWYTESFIEILGEESFSFHGNLHKYLTKLILSLVGPENLRKKVVHELNELTCRHLHSWANHGSFNVKEGASQMIFEYFCKKLISYDETKDARKLRENYKAFIDGLFSFPLNIPGTAFHACLRGRKKVIKVIGDIYRERKASKICRHDFMDDLLEEVEKEETIMNESMAINLIFLILFAAHETTSSGITLLTKYIFDHPHVLEELTKEHETILRNREEERSEITWEEYKSMTFTHMVINEALRLANIVPGIFRRVMNDVQIKGYTIPAGWLVMMVPSVLHLNPDKYEDPLAFNPWRWEGQELHAGSKTFMAFGGGVRLCVGADFTKLQMAILLHHLVTKYRWSVIKGGDVIRRPGLIFQNGPHIKIAEKYK
ncbi:Cytochrome P450 [Melia azedarach]|uniref:Cytochrome P450 n=1 Tax=Melia azedarach TaxID=155640 RepID=A0ACC1YTG6_MELAZ|nr:Cytochrome P450 [Melia azedarach]